MGNITPRMRMFAGPNGSGKSTLKGVVKQELLGVYINPDDIEKDIRVSGFLDLTTFEVETSSHEILTYFIESSLLSQKGLTEDAARLSFTDGKLLFNDVAVNSYFTSVAADFIRQKLLGTKTTFTYETVMSHKNKVELLKRAQGLGFRTYLYYVATEDPEINISRVENRVKEGGHSVPEEKIIARYYRSLDLLSKAVQYSDRAYIFDNSSHEKAWVAEITNGGDELEYKTDTIPHWLKMALLDQFDQINESDA